MTDHVLGHEHPLYPGRPVWCSGSTAYDANGKRYHRNCNDAPALIYGKTTDGRRVVVGVAGLCERCAEASDEAWRNELQRRRPPEENSSRRRTAREGGR